MTVLYQDIGDGSGGLGGDTSSPRQPDDDHGDDRQPLHDTLPDGIVALRRAGRFPAAHQEERVETLVRLVAH